MFSVDRFAVNFSTSPFEFVAPIQRCFGASLQIADKIPAKFDVVTRDLSLDFGEFTLTGLAFSPDSKHVAWGCEYEEWGTVRVFERPYGRRYERERILDGDDTLSAPVDGVSPLTVRELFAVLQA